MVVDLRPPGNDSHQPGLLRREERGGFNGRTRSSGRRSRRHRFPSALTPAWSKTARVQTAQGLENPGRGDSQDPTVAGLKASGIPSNVGIRCVVSGAPKREVAWEFEIGTGECKGSRNG